MQQNEGALRPLRIVTRQGSILEPGWTAPVAAGNHETTMRVVDAVFRAMQYIMPERLSAGGPTTSGVLVFAEPRKTAWRMRNEVHGGGEGARQDRAGVSATRVHLSNTSNTPAEVLEANYSIGVERQAIRRRSGGAGAPSRRGWRDPCLSGAGAADAFDDLRGADGGSAVWDAWRRARQGLSHLAGSGRVRTLRSTASRIWCCSKGISSRSRPAAAVATVLRPRNEGIAMSRLLRTGLNAGDSAPMAVVGGEGVYFRLQMAEAHRR